jgi:hypothetical protein
VEITNMSGDGDELRLHQPVKLDHIVFAKSDVLEEMTPAGWYPCSAHQTAGFQEGFVVLVRINDGIDELWRNP